MRLSLCLPLLLIIILLGGIVYFYNQTLRYKELYLQQVLNIKAYLISNSEYKNRAILYQMTIGELEHSIDSIDKKLIKALLDLKIKERTVLFLQYQTSLILRSDTILINDTIFTENLLLDTTILDKWYRLLVELTYPSLITITPTFSSEKYIIVNLLKEYNNKPSKLFFIRWFLKKHKIIVVNVEEKSPYIENKEMKFIKILK